MILPYSQLSGATVVGSGCVIGPSAVIVNSRLGDRVIVRSSTVEDSEIADDADVGPYSHVRAGSEIGSRTHVGNFVEIKNAHLASGVKVGHFSYIGDAAIGEETQHRRRHGDSQFRRRATSIRPRSARAPSSAATRSCGHRSRIGDDARTGAGSVVTQRRARWRDRGRRAGAVDAPRRAIVGRSRYGDQTRRRT